LNEKIYDIESENSNKIDIKVKENNNADNTHVNSDNLNEINNAEKATVNSDTGSENIKDSKKDDTKKNDNEEKFLKIAEKIKEKYNPINVSLFRFASWLDIC